MLVVISATSYIRSADSSSAVPVIDCLISWVCNTVSTTVGKTFIDTLLTVGLANVRRVNLLVATANLLQIFITYLIFVVLFYKTFFHNCFRLFAGSPGALGFDQTLNSILTVPHNPFPKCIHNGQLILEPLSISFDLGNTKLTWTGPRKFGWFILDKYSFLKIKNLHQ